MADRERRATHVYAENEVVQCNGVPAVIVEVLEDGHLPAYWVRFDGGKIAKVHEEELVPL